MSLDFQTLGPYLVLDLGPFRIGGFSFLSWALCVMEWAFELANGHSVALLGLLSRMVHY